jgi:uncharacterized membrane protein YraQ (UPF0718 family)
LLIFLYALQLTYVQLGRICDFMEYVFTTAGYIWRLTAIMAPSLLFGFFVAGILSLLVTPEMVYQHLGRSSLWQICKASLFGVPLPLCSCSVLPVAASLRKNGAGRGSVISFLTSTPQTGVDSIFITYTMLGPVFALIRCVTAFLSGIICGSVVQLFVKDSPDEKLTEVKDAAADCKCSCNEALKPTLFHRSLKAMRYAFITLPEDIGRSMIVGLLISGVLSAFLPVNYFADKFIGNEFISMLAMLIFGLLVYVCSSGSVPIVISLIALCSGYLLNLFLDSSYVAEVVHGSHDGISVFSHISALILLGLLAPALLPKRKE